MTEESPPIRQCDDLPTLAAIGLLNGNTRIATLVDFDLDTNVSHLTISIPRTLSESQALQEKIEKRAIAYVGFRNAGLDPNAREDVALKEYTIHIVGKRSFHVAAAPAEIEHPVGFYAWPVSRDDLCREYFFFSHAINAREDKEPLGSLLLKDGLIANEDIERGLTQQLSNKNAPLGQILVERDVVPPEDIDQAAQDQLRKAKQGRHMRLGEILVEAGLATEEDIRAALEEQKVRKGKRLGQVLVELGIVDEVDVASTLAKKFHLPFVDLDKAEMNPEALNEIPITLIEKYRVFPFQTTDSKITIAISDPLAMEPLDMLRFSIKKQICEVIVTPSQLEDYIHTYLASSGDTRSKTQLTEILAELEQDEEEISDTSSATQRDFIEAREEDSAIAKLVNRIILDAYRKGASDIHVEPYGAAADMIIRFRIDGVCSVYQTVSAANRHRVVARIKIMAGLDIAERRKPQDGKIRFRIAQRLVELRVATIPTVNGNEDVVLRILAGAGSLPLDQMSFSERNLHGLRDIVQRPYGLILCVGPTGSGKTTTLHAMVSHINQDSRKIWTAEDPVEITQFGLRQVQVKPSIGFTFAAAMRSFLRADPDVILVGEMRDQETASIGVEASLTGHLVLSTLHTNSAAETITRLVDMGLDRFSFADALLGVLAQRLARRLCSNCKEPYTADKNEYDELAHFYGRELLERRLAGKPLALWRAPGCVKCEGNGYKGRLGIHELLIMSETLRAAIQRHATVDELVELAREGGMNTLLHDGLEKSIEGLTDVKQVLSVCSR